MDWLILVGGAVTLLATCMFGYQVWTERHLEELEKDLFSDWVWSYLMFLAMVWALILGCSVTFG